MESVLEQALNLPLLLEQLRGEDGLARLLLLLFPLFLVVELPLTLMVILGVLRWWIREQTLPPRRSLYRPRVSCVITCYSEGADVRRTLETLCEQTYPGEIELIPVVDGAAANRPTLEAVRGFELREEWRRTRRVRPIAKWQRGGRVSSLNAGLSMSTGSIVMALDGDTSFDNTMVSAIVRHFEDPDVPAVAGSLRVRNTWTSLATALQAIEYLISIQMAKTGLSEWNLVNNISGAFGAFRREIIEQLGGWDTHSAEDLDITLRIKSYFGRHRRLRIPFEPKAIGHTDVPTSMVGLLRQRLRWDGDLLFLYARKHSGSIAPRLMGWPNFLMTVISGLFIQVVLPFLIVGYTIVTVITLPWSTVLALALLVDLVYTVVLSLQFLLTLLLVSERPQQDLRLLPLLPLFPVAMLLIRCWSMVAILNELWRRSHEESSMAPWWVLRRATRF
jgi:biofilm PGA synthesis N-glycosyltransferase PgaC